MSGEWNIDLTDIRMKLGGKDILKGISLSFEHGQIVSIMGPSGCGKTTLLRIINGLLKPDSGKVMINDTDVTNYVEHEWDEMRKDIGIVFQGGALFDSMTVGENVAFPLVHCRHAEASEISSRVTEMLSLVNLPGIESRYPNELSGGMRKRVSIARALAHYPKIVLYDEPTSGLDPIVSTAIDDLILTLSRHFNVTSVVVTHDMGSAFRVSDRMALLYEGEVLVEGTRDEIRSSNNPVLLRFMHGELSLSSNGNGAGGETK